MQSIAALTALQSLKLSTSDLPLSSPPAAHTMLLPLTALTALTLCSMDPSAAGLPEFTFENKVRGQLKLRALCAAWLVVCVWQLMAVWWMGAARVGSRSCI